MNDHVSQIYLFSLWFLHFVFWEYHKGKPRCQRSHFITYPPCQESLKNAKHAYLLLNSKRDSYCTHWPSPSTEKMHPPTSFAPSSPISSLPSPLHPPPRRPAKAGHTYFKYGDMHIAILNFTPLNIMSCGGKVTASLPVRGTFWSTMVTNAGFPPV